MKFERSPADAYLLFGVLVLIVASIFGFMFFAQRQEKLELEHPSAFAVHRPAPQQTHQPRRSKKERSSTEQGQ